ncbi:hypothetical protein F5Y02DRAFT_429546 [Annulohypoxylon stygium]|nr:hypothetical protein F5Y02DRAFT_429546 [Annulohypoxylon stygium]
MTSKHLVHRLSLSSQSTPRKKSRHKSPRPESPPASDKLPTKETIRQFSRRRKEYAWDITGKSLYRVHNLEQSGVQIHCYANIGSRIPRWVKDLVSDSMNPDKTVLNQSNRVANPSESRLREFHRLYCQLLYVERPCLNEPDLQLIQRMYIGPLTLWQLNLPVLKSAEDELFAEPHNDKYLERICRPFPDRLFGYRQNSFESPITSLPLHQHACVISKIMFPYLLLQVEPTHDYLWRAENRCAGGSVVAMRISEGLLGYEQPIFSVALNDEIARVYITLSRPRPLVKIKGRFERYYYTCRLKDFHLQVFEDFVAFWKTLVHIHEWAYTTRFEKMKKILEKKAEELVLMPPPPLLEVDSDGDVKMS